MDFQIVQVSTKSLSNNLLSNYRVLKKNVKDWSNNILSSIFFSNNWNKRQIINHIIDFQIV